MLLIACISAPLLAAALSVLTLRITRIASEDAPPRPDPDAGSPFRTAGASRWEGLAQQIERRQSRPRRQSSAELGERHLAAVLPADARR